MVVGSFNKDGRQHAFLWHDGNLQVLKPLYGDLGLPAQTTAALGINNDGDIVGYSSHQIVYKGKVVRNHTVATAWKANDNWEITELLPDSLEDTRAILINDSKLVICKHPIQGDLVIDLKNDQHHRFSWGGSGNYSSLTNVNCFTINSHVVAWLTISDHSYADLSMVLVTKDAHNGFWENGIQVYSVNNTEQL